MSDAIINLKKEKIRPLIKEIHYPELNPPLPIPKIEKPEEKIATEKSISDERKLLSTILEWKAEEFEKITKDKEWFWAGAVVAVALVITAIVQKNFLFILVVALSALVVYIYANKSPRVISFAITARGVGAANRIYEFHDLKSFWIFYDPPRLKELSIESKKHLMPRITIPLGDTDPVKLREILLNFIPEVRHEEGISDLIARSLGF